MTAHNPRNFLLDGPLMLAPERREARVAAMATELLAHNAFADRGDAIRTLRSLDFPVIDVFVLVDDARQVAVQHLVEREMCQP